MNSFKKSLKVCKQNFRKWRGDYKVLVVLVFVLIISNYNASWFLNFAKTIDHGEKIAPWIYVFSFTSWGFVKIMMFLPLLLLFSNAPFIDENQPFIIYRCSRKSWGLGQVLYIILGSFIYVITTVLSSIVMLIGNLDLTGDWGRVIRNASKGESIEGAASTGVSSKILYYFSPEVAMFYTIILVWFSCILIGLTVYIINSLTKNMGCGVFAGGLLIVMDYVQSLLTGTSDKFYWISYISPISWCSIDFIDINGNMKTPNITYVLCGYIILIVVLTFGSIFVSRRKEIRVIQNT